MKLIYAGILALAATTLATPARRYNQNRNRYRPQQKPDELADGIDNLEELQKYAEKFYMKHGADYQRDLMALATKLQKGLESGRSAQQKQANVEAILLNNASKFNMSRSEAQNLIRQNQNNVQQLLNSVNISQIQSKVNDRTEDVVDDLFDMIENDDVKKAAEDAKEMVFKSLNIDEDASVKETFLSLFEMLDDEFDIQGNVDDVVNNAKEELGNLKKNQRQRQ